MAKEAVSLSLTLSSPLTSQQERNCWWGREVNVRSFLGIPPAGEDTIIFLPQMQATKALGIQQRCIVDEHNLRISSVHSPLLLVCQRTSIHVIHDLASLAVFPVTNDVLFLDHHL